MSNAKDKIVDKTLELIPTVYEDLAQPTVQLMGTTIERSTKALLSPIRGMLWGWEKIEEWVCNLVNSNVEDIPDENKKTPNLEIAIPLIESMRYNANNDFLRNMYAKLLVKSMDNRQDKYVHPAYVEIIKQMNYLDAILFTELNKKSNYIKAINPHIGGGKNLQGKFYSRALPEWYIGINIEGYDMFDISASLLRLSRLGLIDLLFDRTVGKESYMELVQNPEIQQQLQRYKQEKGDATLEIFKIDSVVNVNDFGKIFANICLG